MNTLAQHLTATIQVMQSSSNELSTLVSGKAKCKQMKATTLCLIILEQTCVDGWVGGMIQSLNQSCVGFNPSLKRPTCLASLKVCDTTKQSVSG